MLYSLLTDTFLFVVIDTFAFELDELLLLRTKIMDKKSNGNNDKNTQLYHSLVLKIRPP